MKYYILFLTDHEFDTVDDALRELEHDYDVKGLEDSREAVEDLRGKMRSMCDAKIIPAYEF